MIIHFKCSCPTRQAAVISMMSTNLPNSANTPDASNSRLMSFKKQQTTVSATAMAAAWAYLFDGPTTKLSNVKPATSGSVSSVFVSEM